MALADYLPAEGIARDSAADALPECSAMAQAVLPLALPGSGVSDDGALRLPAVLTFDLGELGIIPQAFHEFHVTLRADGLVRLAATLDAYPERGRRRAWNGHAVEAFERQVTARFDLATGEDGGLSAETNPRLTLTLAGDAAAPEEITLSRVAFVRRTISIEYDPLAVEPLYERGYTGWTYTLTVRNEDAVPHLARLWLHTAALKAFDPSWASLDLTLRPRETRRVSLALSMPEAERRRRPAGFAEPAQVFVQPLDIAAPAATPLYGGHALTLWAVIPPDVSPPSASRSAEAYHRTEALLREPWGTADEWPERVGLLAETYAAGGDQRYAAAVRDLLLARARPDAPTLPVEALGPAAEWYAMVRADAALGEEDRRVIEDAVLLPALRRAFRQGATSPAARAAHALACVRAVVALGRGWPLLGEALYGPRGFFAGVARDFTAEGLPREEEETPGATVSALAALAQLLARHEVNVMTAEVKRLFDGLVVNTPDGLAEHADVLAFAYAVYGDPRYLPTLRAAGLWPPPGLPHARAKALPKDAAPPSRSTLLHDAGILWLREVSPHGFRALHVAYRAASHPLHVSLYAPRLLSGAAALPDAIGRNAMVVDGQNPLPGRARLAVFLNGESRPAALFTEDDDAPLFSGVRFARVVALLDGLFFIGELYHARETRCFDWPFHVSREASPRSGAGMPRLALPLAPRPKALGDRDGYPRLSGVEAATTSRGFAARIPGERQAMHLTFAPMTRALVARARAPHDEGTAPLLLVRQETRLARLGAALDLAPLDGPGRVTLVINTPVAVGRQPVAAHTAAAWVVHTTGAAYLVLINRTGETVTAAGRTTADPLAVERL